MNKMTTMNKMNQTITEVDSPRDRRAYARRARAYPVPMDMPETHVTSYPTNCSSEPSSDNETSDYDSESESDCDEETDVSGGETKDNESDDESGDESGDESDYDSDDYESDSDEDEEGGEMEEERHSWRDDNFPRESVLFSLSDHYQMRSRLSTVEFDAVVYDAIHRNSGERVVVKIINGVPDAVPKNVRILTNVRGNKNIISLREWFKFEKEECYAIVLDHVNGDDTKQLWGDKTGTLSFTKQLLSSMKALHDQNVIYRDVKLENVMWDGKTNTVVLIDFDLATFQDNKNLHTSYVGTDGFFAPEVTAIRNSRKTGVESPYKGYTQKIDMWGIGIVLLSLLYKISEQDIMNKYHEEGELQQLLYRLSEDSTGMNTSMFDLCKQLLVKDPSMRINVDQALAHPCFM
jgi:tRNA A-37 threonylcarbamoyl transferase component Bud32